MKSIFMLPVRFLALAGQTSKCSVKEREANLWVCFLCHDCPWPRAQQLRHQSWLDLSAVLVRDAQNLPELLSLQGPVYPLRPSLAQGAACILRVGYLFALWCAGWRGWWQTLLTWVVCLSVEPAAGARCAQRHLGVTSGSHTVVLPEGLCDGV